MWQYWCVGGGGGEVCGCEVIVLREEPTASERLKHGALSRRISPTMQHVVQQAAMAPRLANP